MHFHRIAAATGLAAILGTLPASGWAAASDYRFEVASVTSAGSGKSDVAVRLVHAPDGKTLSDAVVFDAKADMGPSGMPTMPGKVTAKPVASDGLYHFEAETGMEGKWALHLAAKVQGEAETVRADLTFDAK